MKKVLISTILIIAMTSLGACGSSAETINTDVSNLSVEEMQELIEELQAENAELKDKLEDFTSEEFIHNEIKFADAGFEAYYRHASGNLGGVIKQEDLDKITYLEVNDNCLYVSYDVEVNNENGSYRRGEYYGERELINDGTFNGSSIYNINGKVNDYIKIVSLEDVKYFRNLKVLTIGFDSINTDFIDSLTDLQVIDIGHLEIEKTTIAQYVKEKRPEVYIEYYRETMEAPAPAE